REHTAHPATASAPVPGPLAEKTEHRCAQLPDQRPRLVLHGNSVTASHLVHLAAEPPSPAPPRRSQSAGASAFPPALRFRSPDAERATNAPGNRREMVPPLLLADAAEKAFPAIQRERGTANRRRTCCEWRQVQELPPSPWTSSGAHRFL